MCLEIYALDSTKFLSAPGLAWEAALKKTKVKLDPITDIDMLLTLICTCVPRGHKHYIEFDHD